MGDRRLTDRQVIVLAALERHEAATVLELWEELPGLVPSDIVRVLEALEGRELVQSEGDRERVYVGGVTFRIDRAKPN